jgi:hypothetical protein
VTRLVGEVLEESLDIDGRAFKTLRALVLQPGFLTSEFLAGRRRAYTSPLRLYLVISVAFFLFIAWLASKGALLEIDQTVGKDAAGQARFMSDQLPRMMFLLMPAFAILLKLSFWRRLYFDHLIHAIHLHSAAFIVFAIMMPMEQVASEHWLPLLAQSALLIYFLGYFASSLRRVYNTNWLMAALKTLAILTAYLVIVGFFIEQSSSFLILSD